MIDLPSVFEGIADADAEHPEFELCDPADSDFNIKAWLGALPSDGTRLISFAQDGTGSLFCLWLRPGLDDVEAAPVVYLGSEGELGVLAKDPAAFLEIVAAGVTFDGHSGSFFDSNEDDPDPDEAGRRERVSEWVSKQIGKPKLRAPDEVRAEAEAAHPGFAAWIEANNAHLQGR